MDKGEFFLLIPAIIYGVTVVDLMKIFQHKKNYWELILWGLCIFMCTILLWTELYQKLDMITENIRSFFVVIIQSLILAQIVAVITPEETDVDTKEYFLQSRKKFFLIIALSLFVNLVMQYLIYDDQRSSWFRPTALVLVLTCAFWDNRWFRTAVCAFFYIMGFIIIFS